MCGIAGFIGIGDANVLKKMTDSIAHRGPDAEGFWQNEDNGVYLGHRRLSIIDIAGGAQPMWDVDNCVCIIFNGEIYNHLELREELKRAGHRFASDHSDTEVLLEGYKAWGKELPNRLNGMWAFAIYDQNVKQVFISRDRFGKKPLFYTFQNNTLVFGSELTCIEQHPQAKKEIAPLSLKKYFAYGYIPAPHTLYKQVYKLPGGHNLLFDLKERKPQIEQYWEFQIEPFDEIPANAEQVWGEQILHLLDAAVKRRLMSDVPLGVFLSGGVDSSSVTALASRYVASHKLRTFSIGFDESSFDESAYASLIAKKFSTNHTLERLSVDKARDYLSVISGMLDEPMGDSSLLPTYLLCNITRKHVTVAVGGDGADELFAGYDPFKALKLAKIYNTFVPKRLHTGVLLAVNKLPTSHSNMSFDFKLKRTLRGLAYPEKIRNTIWLGPLDPKSITELFDEPIDIEELYSEAIEVWDNSKQHNLVDRTLNYYIKLYLQDDILVKVDRASMMNSLEVRAPYLDIDLVNLARRIPHQYKYRNGEGKYILKKALEPILPKEILYRSKKGFGVPIGKWFKQGAIDLNFDLNAIGLKQTYINRLVQEHKSGKADHRAALWNLWLLQKTQKHK